jgi:hypothetical protein
MSNRTKKWAKVYRGIPNSPDKIDLNNAGTHWTPNLEVAKSFASSHFEGTVLEGAVHKDEVVKPHTEEWYEMGGIRPGSEDEQLAEAGMHYHNNVAIHDPGSSDEQEITVRKRGLVHIGRLHHFKDGAVKARTNINATGTA